MGAWPARITAADFLTPPEFARFSLASQAAGTIGGVRVELGVEGGTTRLTECYQQAPVCILPLYLGAGVPTLLYLLNPTAGLMEGDAHAIEIEAGPGTRCLLVGQSATRIHPSDTGFCTQQWRLKVRSGALLIVLPGPAIPYQSARYYQRVEAD